jgi:hypothetical protein
MNNTNPKTGGKSGAAEGYLSFTASEYPFDILKPFLNGIYTLVLPWHKAILMI